MHPYDLFIVAPNSAIDSYYDLADLKIGQVNKARRSFHTAGGKGFNAARALQRLGGRAFCTGIVAGKAGDFIINELDHEKIAHDLVWGEGESRRCNTIYFPGPNDTTVILESGTRTSEFETIEAFNRCILSHTDEAPYIALVGSLPEGFPPDFYAEAIRQLKAKNSRVCVDSSGEPLRSAMESGPWMVKVNREEFQAVFFSSETNVHWLKIQEIYYRLHERGVEILVITDGNQGAYLLAPDGDAIHVLTPVQKIVSSAGSGDTFLAALLLALGRGSSLEEAACYASAAAAANLLELGCGFFQPDKVNELLSVTRLEHISPGVEL
jgi:tagatose 6-phosphate kinase